MLKDHITFMVVPENRSHPLKLRITMTQFYILAIIMGILAVLFLVGVFMGSKYTKIYIENKTLIAQNQNLNNQLDRVRSLESKISKIDEMENYLRRMLGETDEEISKNIDEIEPSVALGYFSSALLNDPKSRKKFIPDGLPQDGKISMTMDGLRSIYKDKHEGIDIALPANKPIFSTAAGKVVYSGYDNEYGNLVVIDHMNGYITKYAHLGKIVVVNSDIIDKNTIIGFSGSTGKSIGTHLHYEVLKDGLLINPLDSETDTIKVQKETPINA